MSAYDNAHNAVKRAWGPASLWPCTWCGCTASDWSYGHSDPDEKRDERTGLPYSNRIDHYAPLCRKCHRSYDAVCLREGRMSAAEYDRLRGAAWDRVTDERREVEARRRDTQMRLFLKWHYPNLGGNE
ncbi:hypothetical protein GCM10023238_21610 [Streptomyces heliomycini]